MNKTAIKNYAIWARVQLIEAVKQRAFEYEITESGDSNPNADSVGGRVLTDTEKEQRRQLLSEISRKGYDQVMEEAAYTWFNRFIALRFMEVNGYLPSKVRVFTDENNAFKPEILKQAMTVELDGLDREKVLDLLDKQNNEELYKYLLITQCNALNKSLPYLFERVANWTELLFPSNLLRSDSIIEKLVFEIPEDDWHDAVQIIGWFFEGYVQDRREEYRRETTVTKKTMATVNQVFTPDWIVQYMVENTVGRIWINSNPDSKLIDSMNYYIGSDSDQYIVPKKTRPMDIRVIEPCCGSGHILVYVFDLFMRIYEEAGYIKREIPSLILKYNIWGFDIDGRAAQLAYFSLMMKAREYDRRFFSKHIQPHIFEYIDSKGISEDYVSVMKSCGFSASNISIASYLVDSFRYGKVLGTTTIFKEMNYSSLIDEIHQKRSTNLDLFSMQFFEYDANVIIRMAQLAIELTNKYDVLITNPPYSFLSKLQPFPKDYLLRNYPSSTSKCNFCSIFLETHLVRESGFVSMITSMLWTKQKSFEKIRRMVLTNDHIYSMLFIGADEVNAMVETVSFVIQKGLMSGCGKYYALSNIKNRQDFLTCVEPNTIDQASFLKLPSSLINEAFKENDISIHNTSEYLSSVLNSRDGLHTCNNNLFLRLWTEVDSRKVGFDCESSEKAILSRKKWFPYCKGGEYRKWYGNNDYLVNWENDGNEMKNLKNPKTGKVIAHNFNGDFAFLEGLTWTYRSSTGFAVRYTPVGFLFDSKGSKAFLKSNISIYPIIGLLNSAIGKKYVGNYATTAFEVGTVLKVPYRREICCNERIEKLSNESVSMSKEDWDSFETSWDFKKHPLV